MNKCKSVEASNKRGHKGSKCFTDGKVTIMLFPDDEVPEGFKPGRKPTKWNPWSKGLTKYTDERVRVNEQKRLESRVYISLSDETKQKLSESMKDKKPWNTNKKLPLEMKQHISEGMIEHHKYAIQNNPLFYEKQKEKLNATMHKNNSFAKSKTEDNFYKKLCNEYGVDNVLRQYSEERYPWKCDFYIKSLDKFIEFNGHWTHGKHPFNPLDNDDIKLLEQWKQRSESSSFYKTAIYVWTKNDPQKLQTLRNNNLNFEIIYKDLIINK